MPGQSFERDIVHAFNNYFEMAGVKGISYRHIQTRYQPQLFDVHVDTRGMELYLALECKSIDPNASNGIYFRKSFNWQKGICQVERENTWLGLSGRNGFLVVELRRGVRKRTTVFFVPWRTVWHAFERNAPAIYPEQITYCPCCDKRAGKYVFDDEFINDLVKAEDTSGRDVKRRKKKWTEK